MVQWSSCIVSEHKVTSSRHDSFFFASQERPKKFLVAPPVTGMRKKNQQQDPTSRDSENQLTAFLLLLVVVVVLLHFRLFLFWAPPTTRNRRSDAGGSFLSFLISFWFSWNRFLLSFSGFALSLSLSGTLSRSFSLSHTHTHSHTLARTHSISLKHTHSPTHAFISARSHTSIYTASKFTLAHMISLSKTLTRTHIQLAISLSLIHSISHTRVHNHTPNGTYKRNGMCSVSCCLLVFGSFKLGLISFYRALARMNTLRMFVQKCISMSDLIKIKSVKIICFVLTHLNLRAAYCCSLKFNVPSRKMKVTRRSRIDSSLATRFDQNVCRQSRW